MIIQCPACKTKFKIPDGLFGDKKIVKFQCSRCKNVFKFDMHKGRSVEPGEESVKLQPEYKSFEAEGQKQFPPPQEAEEEEEEKGEDTLKIIRKKPLDQVTPQYESFEKQKPAGDRSQGQQSVPSSSPREVHWQKDEKPSSGEPIIPRRLQEAPPAQRQYKSSSVAGEQSVSSPVQTQREPVYAPAPYLLEMESVFEQGTVRVSSPAMRFAGIAGICLFALFVVLFVYISGKNGWDFTTLFTNTSEALAVAFGGKEKLEIAPEAKGLETAVTRSYMETTSNGVRLFIVEGEVLNTTVFPKKEVRVHVRVIEGDVEVISVEVPAGVTLLPREKVAQRSYSEIRMYIEKEKKSADEWILTPHRKVSFQAFIPDPPEGIASSQKYVVEAIAVSAVNALSP